MSRLIQLRKHLHSKPGPQFAKDLAAHWHNRCVELLHGRGNLSRDDLVYLAETATKLKDERLKTCIATLIGWGDDERAELETFCAIAVEVIKDSPPSRLRNAALRVGIQYHLEDIEKGGKR